MYHNINMPLMAINRKWGISWYRGIENLIEIPISNIRVLFRTFSKNLGVQRGDDILYIRNFATDLSHFRIAILQAFL